MSLTHLQDRNFRGLQVEAVIFVGLQASGKSTFYQERFFRTHLRINLDMLKTRHRERKLLQVCIETQQPFVIDNTNPTREERAVYMTAAKQAGFRIIAYIFSSRIEDCKRRNALRSVDQQIPLIGMLGTAGRMQIPTRDEGYDARYYVQLQESTGFVVEAWRDEV